MKKGFTLIEILVVTTIIGLLAASGVATYSQFARQSRDAKRKADLQQISLAVESYRSDLGSYPASLTFGGTICDPGGCGVGTYMSTVPQDPRSGQTYTYTVSGSDYTMGALLEQGGTGTCGTCGSGACNYCVGPYGEK